VQPAQERDAVTGERVLPPELNFPLTPPFAPGIYTYDVTVAHKHATAGYPHTLSPRPLTLNP